MNISIYSKVAATPVQQSALQKSLEQNKQTIVESPTLNQDSVEIRKGVLPTLKGAGAGALAGGTLAATSLYVAARSFNDEYASLASVMGGGLGVVTGAVVGAVVANVTDDKKKAALYGAAIGGGVGVALGLATGDLKGAVSWGVLGASAGVGGAFGGAAVANRK